MKDETKDFLTIWGYIAVGMLAFSYALDHYGNIGGFLALIPIVMLGYRIMCLVDDLRHCERSYETMLDNYFMKENKTQGSDVEM
jgi:uncharacterized membrane protein